jgi:hypothetical protein
MHLAQREACTLKRRINKTSLDFSRHHNARGAELTDKLCELAVCSCWPWGLTSFPQGTSCSVYNPPGPTHPANHWQCHKQYQELTCAHWQRAVAGLGAAQVTSCSGYRPLAKHTSPIFGSATNSIKNSLVRTGSVQLLALGPDVLPAGHFLQRAKP